MEKPKPDDSAGFNAKKYDASSAAVEAVDPVYTNFPTAQGQADFPSGLLTEGDLDMGQNFIMSGVYLLNYTQYPDKTRQYTAYVPNVIYSPSIFSFSSGYATYNQTLMVPIEYIAPVGAATFTASCWAGAGSAIQYTNIVPNPPVNGQPFTSTSVANSSSGTGLKLAQLPVVEATRKTVRLVLQPNLFCTGAGPQAVRWEGTCQIQWGAQQIILTTTTSGAVANMAVGSPISITNPPFGCPTSVVISSLTATANTFNFFAGVGNTTSTYYVNQLTPIPAVGQTRSVWYFYGTVQISSSGLLTVITQTNGTGLEKGVVVIGANFSCIITQVVSATTFYVTGIKYGFDIPSSLAFGYQMFSGNDAFLSAYLPALTPVASIRGSVVPFSATPQAAGAITTYSSASAITQYIGTLGAAGVTQTTQSYPTGMVTSTQAVVQNSAAVATQYSVIANGAASMGLTISYPSTTINYALTQGGLGSMFITYT